MSRESKSVISHDIDRIRNSTVIVRANHLAVEVPLQILVDRVARAGALKMPAPDSRGIATHICSRISTGR